MEHNIQSLTDQITDFFCQYSVKQLEYNRISPASTQEIASWEAEIGNVLPQDYRDFLLHNQFEFNICFNYQMLSLAHAKGKWTMMNELLEEGTFDDGRIDFHVKNHFGNWEGERIQKVWWTKDWIPFAVDSCGNMYCIDLAPGAKGKQYQIMSMEVQDGQGPFINNMFKDFKDCLAKNLQYTQDKKFYLEDYGDGVQMPSIDPFL